LAYGTLHPTDSFWGAAPSERFQRTIRRSLSFPPTSPDNSRALLQARLGIAPYMEQGGTFAPLGDEHGLILVVAVGRPWNLIHSAARAVPVSVTVQGAQGERISLPHLPEGLL